VRCREQLREARKDVQRAEGQIRPQAARGAEVAVPGCAGSAVEVRWWDVVRVSGRWCGTSVEAWNGRRGQDMMTGPVCEGNGQVEQRVQKANERA
jgi:hypothetical protein